MVTSFPCLSDYRVYGVGYTLVGTCSFLMNTMEATLVQLPLPIINSHTLPLMVGWMWKILLPLARFKRNLFGVESFLNYQQYPNIWSDQSVILLFKLFFTIIFLNGLDFLYLSNGESSLIRIIRLEISIVMALEVLLSFQSLMRFTSNSLTLAKGSDRCRDYANLIEGGENLEGTLRPN